MPVMFSKTSSKPAADPAKSPAAQDDEVPFDTDEAADEAGSDDAAETAEAAEAESAPATASPAAPSSSKLASALASKGAAKPAAAKKGATPAFMSAGAASVELQKMEHARVEAQRADSKRMWRFMISRRNLNEDFPVIFLDGDLDPDTGLLTNPSWLEHTIRWNNSWTNVPCTRNLEPCPLCAAGGDKASSSLVMAFTVIDLTPYTIQNGANAGKVIEWSRKLFVPKRKSIAQLVKLASMHGTLRGVQVMLTRTNEDSPNVGDMMMATAKWSDEELAEQFGEGGNDKPANYLDEIVYRTAAEIKELGMAGASSAMAGASTGKASSDLAGKM